MHQNSINNMQLSHKWKCYSNKCSRFLDSWCENSFFFCFCFL